MPTAHLDDRAVVRVAGADAKTLLQNVVTLDMDGVDRHGSGYGALLTPQGKILLDFVLHRHGDGYAADVRGEEAEAFAKRLSLYGCGRRWRSRQRRSLPSMRLADRLLRRFLRASGRGRPPIPASRRSAARWVAPAGSVETDATAADWHRHRIALAVPEGGIDFLFGDAFPA